MNALPPDRLEAIARTVHAALREWGAVHGQDDIPEWHLAPAWMHESTRESVRHAIANPGSDGRAQHDQWVAQKRADGWRHGPVKDAAAKTHPLMVPYEDLPDWERRKDILINAVVRALA
ncbi:MAG: RyR domain-containing protein [Hyphomonas sp.]